MDLTHSMRIMCKNEQTVISVEIEFIRFFFTGQYSIERRMSRSVSNPDENDKTEDDRAPRKFCDGGGV